MDSVSGNGISLWVAPKKNERESWQKVYENLQKTPEITSYWRFIGKKLPLESRNSHPVVDIPLSDTGNISDAREKERHDPEDIQCIFELKTTVGIAKNGVVGKLHATGDGKSMVERFSSAFHIRYRQMAIPKVKEWIRYFLKCGRMDYRVHTSMFGIIESFCEEGHSDGANFSTHKCWG